MKSQAADVSFFLVDVFADQPLQGNPVAVVPQAENLSEPQMQSIAREFNQSETTFLLPPTGPEAHCRLRSFTPEGKEAFGAGHNTLGAWWWLAESGNISLSETGGRFMQEIGEDVLPVHITGGNRRPERVALSQAAPEFGCVLSDCSELAAALGLAVSDLSLQSLPVQVVSTGAAHLLVPIRNRLAIERARPDFPRLVPLLQSVDGEGCYLFTLDAVLPGSAAHARFFNPTLGIIEDAATGTAAGPLACQLVRHGILPDSEPILIEQGYSMRRPSLIRVDVEGEAVRISGRCAVSGQGNLRIHGEPSEP
jgi:trans-2,3-dihydro-3-hydroxyanthranilate isomerase